MYESSGSADRTGDGPQIAQNQIAAVGAAEQ